MNQQQAMVAICGGLIGLCIGTWWVAVQVYAGATGDPTNWWPVPWLWPLLFFAILCAVVGVLSLTGHDQPPVRRERRTAEGEPAPPATASAVQRYILRETDTHKRWHIVALTGQILGTVDSRGSGIRAWAASRQLPGPFVSVDEASLAVVDESERRRRARNGPWPLPHGHPSTLAAREQDAVAETSPATFSLQPTRERGVWQVSDAATSRIVGSIESRGGVTTGKVFGEPLRDAFTNDAAAARAVVIAARRLGAEGNSP